MKFFEGENAPYTTSHDALESRPRLRQVNAVGMAHREASMHRRAKRTGRVNTRFSREMRNHGSMSGYSCVLKVRVQMKFPLFHRVAKWHLRGPTAEAVRFFTLSLRSSAVRLRDLALSNRRALGAPLVNCNLSLYSCHRQEDITVHGGERRDEKVGYSVVSHARRGGGQGGTRLLINDRHPK